MSITLEFKKRDFGAGYSSFSFSETGNSALNQDSTSNSNVISTLQNSGVFQIQVAKSVSELTRQFTAKVEAEGSVLGADVKGSAEFFQRNTLTTNQTYIVATVEVTTEIQNLKPNNIKVDDDAAKRSASDFFDKFGDVYAGEIHFGGLLTMIITVESADSNAKTTFDTSVQAKGGVFSGAGASAKFGAGLQSITSNQEIDIFLSHIGGESPPDDVGDNIASALKYALGFERGVKSAPTPYAAVFFDYSKVSNAPDGIDTFLDQPRKNLAALAALKQQYLPVQGAIETAKKNEDVFALTSNEKDQLAKLAKLIGKDIQTIDQSWKQSDITRIPAPSKLSFNNTPDRYQKQLGGLKLDARSRLVFNAEFFLKWDDDQFIATQKGGFPTVGQGMVALRIPQGSGSLADGMKVFIETTEDSLAKTPRIAGSKNHKDLVYEPASFEAEKQTWIIHKVYPGDRVVRYNDEITLESVYWKGEFLRRRDDKERGDFFLTTTTPGAKDRWVWTIKRPS